MIPEHRQLRAGGLEALENNVALEERLGGDYWHRAWLALTRNQSWRALALVPAGPGGPSDLAVNAAMSLAQAGMVQLGAQIHVADATELPPENTPEFLRQVNAAARSGPVIIALSAPDTNPVTLTLAQACDVAVLCILMGKMRLRDARRTLEQVGRDRFIGAVTFKP